MYINFYMANIKHLTINTQFLPLRFEFLKPQILCILGIQMIRSYA